MRDSAFRSSLLILTFFFVLRICFWYDDKRRWSRRGRRHRRMRGRRCSPKYRCRDPVDADGDTDTDTDTDADTLTRQQTWEPRSRGVSKQAFFSHSPQYSTPSVAVASASSCADSRVPDTELVASPTAVLKRDPDGVEAQVRGLADRQARVEAGLLRITCEETFRQQRRLLHGIFAAKQGEDAEPSGGGCLWPAARRSLCFEISLYCFWLD